MFARNRLYTPVALAVAVLAAFAAFGLAGAWLAFQPGSTSEAEPIFMIVYIPFAVMGAAVIARQPRNPVGWLLAGVGLSANAGFFIEQYATRATLIAPGSLPFGTASAWLATWVWNLLLTCLLFTVVLFPTGRPASPRWRPAVWAMGALMTFVLLVFAFSPGSGTSELENPLAIEALRPIALWVDDSFWLFLIVFGIATASVIARFRSARGIERQQLKWGAGGCVVAGVLLAIANFVSGPIADFGWIVASAAIPVSFAIAILRYGLYEIDVLINRALVYGGVSALLLATYVLGVLALSTLLRPFTDGNDIAVAGSTLAVVALFQPLRSRTQRFVDRRFYRARYDAARTVDEFSARLRDQVDLDQLRGELVRVVDETVRPAHASLWLRGGGERGR